MNGPLQKVGEVGEDGKPVKNIHAEANGLPMKFMHQKFHRIYNYTSLAKPKFWVLTFT